MSNQICYDYQVKLRFRDMDSYGIVHHSNHFSYFEEARCNFAKDCLDFTDGMIQGETIQFPVLEATCKYRKAITYGLNQMTIHLKFQLLDNCKLQFDYSIVDDSNTVYAKARTIHALVVDGKLCLSYPDWIWEKVEAYEARQIIAK